MRSCVYVRVCVHNTYEYLQTFELSISRMFEVGFQPIPGDFRFMNTKHSIYSFYSYIWRFSM